MSIKSPLRNFSDLKSSFTISQFPTNIDTVNLSMQLNHISKMLEDSVMKFTKRYLIVSAELEEMKREFVGQACLINEYLTLTKKEIRFDKFDKFQQGKGMLNVPLCPNYEQKCLSKSNQKTITKTASKTKQSFVSTTSKKNRITSPENKKINKKAIRQIIKEDNKSNNQSNFKTINNMNKKTPSKPRYHSTERNESNVNLEFNSVQNLNLINKKSNIKETDSMTQKEKREYHKGVFDSIKNNKIKSLYTMISMNDILDVNDKIKLSYLNKEILSNIVPNNILNDYLPIIQSKIEDKEQKLQLSEEDRKFIDKIASYPSKTAQTGLNVLTKEKESELINKEDSISQSLVKMIYICAGEEYTDTFSSIKEAYDNLFTKYKVNSIKSLFSDVIYKLIYYDLIDESKSFTVDIEKIINCIESNKELITDSLANNTNKTFSYIAFSIEEICDYLKEYDKIKYDSDIKKKIKEQIDINSLKKMKESIAEKVK